MTDFPPELLIVFFCAIALSLVILIGTIIHLWNVYAVGYKIELFFINLKNRFKKKAKPLPQIKYLLDEGFVRIYCDSGDYEVITSTSEYKFKLTVEGRYYYLEYKDRPFTKYRVHPKYIVFTK